MPDHLLNLLNHRLIILGKKEDQKHHVIIVVNYWLILNVIIVIKSGVGIVGINMNILLNTPKPQLIKTMSKVSENT